MKNQAGENQIAANNEAVKKLTRVLGVCSLLAMGVLLFWLVVYLLATDFLYGIHATFFDITRDEFERANYYGMGFFKLLVSVLFFLPFLSLKIVSRGER